MTRRITIAEFHNEIKAQGAGSREKIVFVCPMCKTPQSAADLIEAGAGSCFVDVEKYLAFSCIGRFTGAGTPSKERLGKGCNWTLGGFLKCHDLEIVADDGSVHPRFELASQKDAAAHNLKGGAV